jgi:CubicO group peptidase (beta-lactamase class C family)
MTTSLARARSWLVKLLLPAFLLILWCTASTHPRGLCAAELPQQHWQAESGDGVEANLGTGPRIEQSKSVSKIEEAIPRLMQEGDVAGLSVALIENGEVVYSRGFGVKNASTGDAVDSDTIFEAASLSKPVVAYAVLKLADAGKLNLDTPLVRYLPGPYVENDSRLDLITARMVMDHTTGFPNWRPIGKPLKIYYDPGSRFSYSGEGFVYLQKVVEHITGKSLVELMRDIVLDPLGMSSSSYVWQDSYEKRLAVGHSQAGIARPVRKPTQPNAAASLHTTAKDYARFVAALLNASPLNSTGLKPETLRQMLTPQIKVSEGCVNCTFAVLGRPSERVSWGLGVGLQQTTLGPAFWHWGDNNNEYHCFMVGFQEKGSGIVIFTNSGNGLSIIPDIISAGFGVRLPAFEWLNYDRYDSPARVIFKSILAQGADSVLAKCREARNSSAKSEVLSESQMNAMGYWLLQRGKTSDAVEVFKQNVADHPQSANTYDSAGEAYMKLGDKEQAIKNYKKSLELNPANANAVQMLKTLEAK